VVRIDISTRSTASLLSSKSCRQIKAWPSSVTNTPFFPHTYQIGTIFGGVVADLTQIQLAAALAEQVYRRNSADNPVTLGDLGVRQPGPPVPAGATFHRTSDLHVATIAIRGRRPKMRDAPAFKRLIYTTLLVGLCLLPIVLRPSVAAEDKAALSSKATDRPIAAPSEVPRLGESSVVEGGNQIAPMPGIPENLRYLFDLPWCSRWRFSCMSCEKTIDGINCFDRRDACQEMFKFYHCEGYSLPKGCVVWMDGCNFCTENGCTLKSCQEYLAPNKPSFACTRYDSNERGGGRPKE
jgi:hypothetical protein